MGTQLWDYNYKCSPIIRDIIKTQRIQTYQNIWTLAVRIFHNFAKLKTCNF